MSTHNMFLLRNKKDISIFQMKNAPYLLLCFLFHQVTLVTGHGKITGPNEVTVFKNDGSTEVVSAKNILIATGSEVTPFPGIEVTNYTLLFIQYHSHCKFSRASLEGSIRCTLTGGQDW